MCRMKKVFYIGGGVKVDNKKLIRAGISIVAFLSLLLIQLLIKELNDFLFFMLQLLFFLNIYYIAEIGCIFKTNCVVEPTKMIFRIHYKKKEIGYNSFDGLILSFSDNGHGYLDGKYSIRPRIKFMPAVSFFFVEKNDKIPSILLERHELYRRKYITSSDVEYGYLKNAEVKYKLGCLESDKNIYEFSSRMDDGAEENIFREFKGDYYITYSVIEKYHDLIQSYITKYKIDAHRIHLIDDRNKTYKQQ